jgi:hypothetical protein
MCMSASRGGLPGPLTLTGSAIVSGTTLVWPSVVYE